MRLTRRQALAAASLPSLLSPAVVRAQSAGAAPPPIVFVHGNGDHAALWMTSLWRFESNGWPRDRLFAFNFTDPLAGSDVHVPAPGRSSPEDQRRELAAAVSDARTRAGAAKVVLIGSSRGGYAIRNFLSEPGGAAQASHAILCGTPNHGVFDWEASPNNEFNGRGPFLKRLNAGDDEVVPGVAVLTLRSDGNDKFAQPDGRLLGRPGVPTGVTADGPALRGAANIVLNQLDHREVAFHPFAFREQFRFIAGRDPERLDVADEPQVVLDGLVTGAPRGEPTNRPVAGATVEIHRISADTGARLGEPVHRRTTGADGRWGPASVEPTDCLEFVLSAPEYPTTHIFRSPFPRSSSIIHLRPGRPFNDADRAAGSVTLMTRPRGYFGLPRDVVLLDNKEPDDVAKGVATDATTTTRLASFDPGRVLIGQFNEERIASRPVPAAENRLAVIELTW